MSIAVEQWQFGCIGWALTPGMIFFTLNTLSSVFLHTSHTSEPPQAMYWYSWKPFSPYSHICASVLALAISVRISLSAADFLSLNFPSQHSLGLSLDKPDLDEAVDAISQDILGHPYHVAECSIAEGCLYPLMMRLASATRCITQERRSHRYANLTA